MVVLINPVFKILTAATRSGGVVLSLSEGKKNRSSHAASPVTSPTGRSTRSWISTATTHQQTHETTKAVASDVSRVASHGSVPRSARRRAHADDLERQLGPYNPNIDPITYTEFLEIKLSRGSDFDRDGHGREFRPGNFGEAFRAPLS